MALSKKRCPNVLPQSHKSENTFGSWFATGSSDTQVADSTVLNLEEREQFPITTADGFVRFVTNHLTASSKDSEPDLVLLSIIFGYLEHEITSDFAINSNIHSSSLQETSANCPDLFSDNKFPKLELVVVEGMYCEFCLRIKANIDRSSPQLTTKSGYATRLLCKSISNVIWDGLRRSYHKDKAHISSIFSYLNGRQLDCFGLAFAVIAACQAMRYKDVHLVISGDHAWASYGNNSEGMVEVTWHGKGVEDRRGLEIDDTIYEKNWIYHGGKAVHCDRWMEVAALIVSINPIIDVNVRSEELCSIQMKLLEFMFTKGYLDRCTPVMLLTLGERYPMAIGAYAEQVECARTVSPSQLESIHDRAVAAAERWYDDMHVYPHCSRGYFYMRHGMNCKAMESWAAAAGVISKYNYKKEDDEIYKEMIEIANNLIPCMLKDDDALHCNETFYYHLIRFYDGVCGWEEGSTTPVLHSWWARHFTHSVNRFMPQTRRAFQHDDDHRDRATTMTGTTGLHVRSEKMRSLAAMLTSERGANAQSVALLMTAQSQVHLVKSRTSGGDYGVDHYSTGAGSRRKKKRPSWLDL